MARTDLDLYIRAIGMNPGKELSAQYDWNWMIPSWVYHHKPDNFPFGVKLSTTSGTDESSHALAARWDDLAQDIFWYRDVTRDVTDDGLPFINTGETYNSIFRFRTDAERARFVAILGKRPVVYPLALPKEE